VSEEIGPNLEISLMAAAHSFASSQPDLEELMVGYQKADSVATTTLIELLSPQLYRFFAAQMGSRSDADDMLQDVWLRIHRARHTYRAGEPLLAWVYAIARRVRVDNYRKRSRLAMREVGTDVLPDVPDQAQRQDQLPRFDDLVASLPQSQREVLIMLKVNGLSLEEIARATSSTVGAVKQKAHRAYERLRNLLQETPTARPAGDANGPAHAQESVTTSPATAKGQVEG
jgi:RNA polymerase sigma-70 factor (ECF subfamily)